MLPICKLKLKFSLYEQEEIVNDFLGAVEVTEKLRGMKNTCQSFLNKHPYTTHSIFILPENIIGQIKKFDDIDCS